MRRTNYDIAWAQAQLTLARWYLDAAADATSEAVHHHLRQARRVYEITMHSLSHLDLSMEQRTAVEGELAVLRSRLEAAGSPPAASPAESSGHAESAGAAESSGPTASSWPAHRIRKRQFKFGPGRWNFWSLKKQ